LRDCFVRGSACAPFDASAAAEVFASLAWRERFADAGNAVMVLADAAPNVSGTAILLVIAASIALRTYGKRSNVGNEARSIAAREAACDLSRAEFAPNSPASWTAPKATLCIVCRKAIPLPGRYSCHECGLHCLERQGEGLIKDVFRSRR